MFKVDATSGNNEEAKTWPKQIPSRPLIEERKKISIKEDKKIVLTEIPISLKE